MSSSGAVTQNTHYENDISSSSNANSGHNSREDMKQTRDPSSHPNLRASGSSSSSFSGGGNALNKVSPMTGLTGAVATCLVGVQLPSRNNTTASSSNSSGNLMMHNSSGGINRGEQNQVIMRNVDETPVEDPVDYSPPSTIMSRDINGSDPQHASRDSKSSLMSAISAELQLNFLEKNKDISSKFNTSRSRLGIVSTVGQTNVDDVLPPPRMFSDNTHQTNSHHHNFNHNPHSNGVVLRIADQMERNNFTHHYPQNHHLTSSHHMDQNHRMNQVEDDDQQRIQSGSSSTVHMKLLPVVCVVKKGDDENNSQSDDMNSLPPVDVPPKEPQHMSVVPKKSALRKGRVITSSSSLSHPIVTSSNCPSYASCNNSSQHQPSSSNSCYINSCSPPVYMAASDSSQTSGGSASSSNCIITCNNSSSSLGAGVDTTTSTRLKATFVNTVPSSATKSSSGGSPRLNFNSYNPQTGVNQSQVHTSSSSSSSSSHPQIQPKPHFT